MIHYVVTRRHADTLATYLDTWGRQFFTTIKPLSYEDLPFYRTLPGGTYVFTDLEMLAPPWLEMATQVWTSLNAAGSACRILNSPATVLRRFDLLRKLHDAGMNDFAAYRADQIDGLLKFPVFVRREHDHSGSLTPLLKDRAELDRALGDLRQRPVDLHGLLVIEFCDTADSRGMYRKYSAMKIGDRILPRHLLAGGDWVLKYPDRVDPDRVAEENQFLQTHPHAEPLADIFKLANVDFGRIDYSLKNGRVQTWEINSNPTFVVPPDRMEPARLAGQWGFVAELAKAWKAIDSPAGAAIDIQIPERLRKDLGATRRQRWRRKTLQALQEVYGQVDRRAGRPVTSIAS